MDISRILKDTFSRLDSVDWSLVRRQGDPLLQGARGVSAARYSHPNTSKAYGPYSGPGTRFKFSLYTAENAFRFGLDAPSLSHIPSSPVSSVARRGAWAKSRCKDGRGHVWAPPYLPDWTRDPHALTLPSTCCSQSAETASAGPVSDDGACDAASTAAANLPQLRVVRTPAWLMAVENDNGEADEGTATQDPKDSQLSVEVRRELQAEFQSFDEHRTFLTLHGLRNAKLFTDETDLIKRMHRSNEASEEMFAALSCVLGRDPTTVASCWLDCESSGPQGVFSRLAVPLGSLGTRSSLLLNFKGTGSVDTVQASAEARAMRSAIRAAARAEAKCVGEDHPAVCHTRIELATSMCACGDLSEAKNQLNQVISVCTSHKSHKKSPKSAKRRRGGAAKRKAAAAQQAMWAGLSARAHAMLGAIVSYEGDHAAAKEQFRSGLIAIQSAYPDGHPFEGVFAALVGAEESVLGAYDEAMASLSLSRNAMAKLLDEEHLYFQIVERLIASLKRDASNGKAPDGKASGGKTSKAIAESANDRVATDVKDDTLQKRIMDTGRRVAAMCKLVSEQLGGQASGGGDASFHLRGCESHSLCDHIAQALTEHRKRLLAEARQVAQRALSSKDIAGGKDGNAGKRVSEFGDPGQNHDNVTTTVRYPGTVASVHDALARSLARIGADEALISDGADKERVAPITPPAQAAVPAGVKPKLPAVVHTRTENGKTLEWVNEIDDAKLPEIFELRSTNSVHPNVSLDQFVYGCTCVGGCKASGPGMCPCRSDSRNRYGEDGRLLSSAAGQVISECNKSCACGPECSNRVVQRSDVAAGARLQVFRTEHKGWGLRTLTDLRERTYVCEYVGEIISEEVAQQRGEAYDKQGCSYLWTQSVAEEGAAIVPYSIDATDFGNESRFINHSCDSNLVAVSVQIETRDSRVPRIGLFTSRRVAAGEELSIDYNYEIDEGLPQHLRIICNCGAKNCRGRLR